MIDPKPRTANGCLREAIERSLGVQSENELRDCIERYTGVRLSLGDCNRISQDIAKITHDGLLKH